MILQTIINFIFSIIEMIFSAFNAISLPIDLLSTLLTFIDLGAFIVGVDLLAIVFGSVIFWLSFKFSAGLILFIYKLIPFV